MVFPSNKKNHDGEIKNSNAVSRMKVILSWSEIVEGQLIHPNCMLWQHTHPLLVLSRSSVLWQTWRNQLPISTQWWTVSYKDERTSLRTDLRTVSASWPSCHGVRGDGWARQSPATTTWLWPQDLATFPGTSTVCSCPQPPPLLHTHINTHRYHYHSTHQIKVDYYCIVFGQSKL